MIVFRQPSRSVFARVIVRALIAALVSLSLPQTTQASFSRSIDASPIDVVDSFADLPSLSARPTIAVLILIADDAAYALVMPKDLLRDVVSVASNPIFANKYHRARWMDPRVGRFVGSDPYAGSADDPGTLHKYLYASSRPVDGTDPTGRQFVAMAMTGLIMTMSIFAIALPRSAASSKRPNRRWIANIAEIEAAVASHPGQYFSEFGESQECVAFTRYFSHAPQARTTWRKGPQVLFNDSVQRGTAIATFGPDGRYMSATDGTSNSAIYVRQGYEDRVNRRTRQVQRLHYLVVWEQYPGYPPHKRSIYDDPYEERSPVNNAHHYSVILTY